MVSHESDLETDAKLLELNVMEQIIRKFESRIRIFQRCTRQLNMIEQQKTKDDGTVEISYILPNDTSGDVIDADHRLDEKKKIIANMDKILAELSVLLPN